MYVAMSSLPQGTVDCGVPGNRELGELEQAVKNLGRLKKKYDNFQSCWEEGCGKMSNFFF